ncbi:MAG: phospholipid carrier-dependent glycosyltransferase [Thermogutta sp.]|uniref:ArnT family glycosyltransferase n=1 Tax=Thermogutta sp. TaxID=1962930 RepID=UPI0019994D92|nr:phospholipid carrier-dependent glycosyltransferase [Thermogutta sp.]MBC7353935.1 phospholipid carrier-dependent glycosyltransferase [Thermogutta sp.]
MDGLPFTRRAPDIETPDPVHRSPMWIGCACGVVTFCCLLFTSPVTPMTWDEGDAIRRAERIQAWCVDLFSPTSGRSTPIGHPFSRRRLWWGFPFTTQREGHPALYGIVIALGEAVAPNVLDPLTRYRFGPILVFAVAVGAAAAKMARYWGPRAGWAAATALILQPRLFAHAHYASFDGPLTAFWLLSWAAFPERAFTRAAKPTLKEDILPAIRWGALLGATMSCKFTGWLAPLPFLIWPVLQRNRRSWSLLRWGFLAALVTFFLCNPPLWVRPIVGMLMFFRFNLHRDQLPGLNIPTYFLGKMYDLYHPLPWYNTLFWTAVAVPLPILLFFVLGLATIGRRRMRHSVALLAAHWGILIIVRAMPGAPPHDGIRLFLPAFAFLGLLAGLGVGMGPKILAEQTADKEPRPQNPADVANHVPGQDRSFPPLRSQRHGLATLASITAWTALLLCVIPLYCFAPQWLSYYNLLIGGLPGATKRGMESTYYWDGLDHDVLLWLRTQCVPGEKVYFSAGSPDDLDLQHAWGWLGPEPASSPADARWYVIQHRPSAWNAIDEWLARHGTPAFVKYAGQATCCPLVGRVWVVKVFPITEYWRASQSTAVENTP